MNAPEKRPLVQGDRVAAYIETKDPAGLVRLIMLSVRNWTENGR